MSSTLHPMLNVAIKAARLAGTIINRAALDVESVRVSAKQTNDFVTEVDHAAEAAIIDTLLTAYPDHAIWAEESGKREGKHGGADHVWIIDPLDGTTNFIHGFPVYCVSIALMVGNKLEQAVIYDPSRNDLFCATRGRGAYMNDRRIRVAKRIAMRECLFSTGFPFRPGDAFQTYMQMLGDVMPKCAGVRRPGSAALDLAYTAAGQWRQTRFGGRAPGRGERGLVGRVKGIARRFQVLVGLGVGGIEQDVAQRLPHLQTLCVHVLQATGRGLLCVDVAVELRLGLRQRPDGGAKTGMGGGLAPIGARQAGKPPQTVGKAPPPGALRQIV